MNYLGFAEWLLFLAKLAIHDNDGTVRVGGAEILSRLSKQVPQTEVGSQAKRLLLILQTDSDHRVVALALSATFLEG